MAYHHRCRTERNAVIEHGEHVTSLRDGVSGWIFHCEAMKQMVSLNSYCVSGPNFRPLSTDFPDPVLLRKGFRSPLQMVLKWHSSTFFLQVQVHKAFPLKISVKSRRYLGIVLLQQNELRPWIAGKSTK